MSQFHQSYQRATKIKAIFRLAFFVFIIVLAVPGCQDALMEKEQTKIETLTKGGSLIYCPYRINSFTNTGYDFTFVINENTKCDSYINFVLLKFNDCSDQPIDMDMSRINSLYVNGKDYLNLAGVLEFTNTSDCCFGSKPGDWDGYILKIDLSEDQLYHPITIEIIINQQFASGNLLLNAGTLYCGGECAGVSYAFDGYCDKPGELTDIEGNVYETVEIGGQTWMAGNLKTSLYNNGEIVGTTVPSTLDISGETDPKYQWAFNADESYVESYGRLYTWYAVTDERKLCPAGWHVPSSDEWTTLSTYLENNGYGYEGSGNDIAKSIASTSDWYSNDLYPGTIGYEMEKNNSSGFNGYPAGERINGRFCWTRGKPGSVTSWWSATPENENTGNWINMINKVTTVERVQGPKIRGASVRCMKD